MKYATLTLCAALLASCGHKPMGIEVRTVEVPVAVSCVKQEQIPAEPPKIGGELTGNPVADTLILAESALLLRKWGGELRALLVGCGG